MKFRLVRQFQLRLLNPAVRLLFRVHLVPPGWALLETRGRKSGQARVTPVGDGLLGDTFWVVAEHGPKAGYVRNIKADPHVRVLVREGLGQRWRSGVASVLPEDDVRERQRTVTRGRPSRVLNAFVVRTVGTELLTVRVDLEP